MCGSGRRPKQRDKSMDEHVIGRGYRSTATRIPCQTWSWSCSSDSDDLGIRCVVRLNVEKVVCGASWFMPLKGISEEVVSRHPNAGDGNNLGFRCAAREKDNGYPVLRGGSWYNDSWYLRVSLLLNHIPSYTTIYIGFRCVGRKDE